MQSERKSDWHSDCRAGQAHKVLALGSWLRTRWPLLEGRWGIRASSWSQSLGRAYLGICKRSRARRMQ